ncbi:MAG: XisI protein [Acidobacteria bacterium]|nr:XisI protein [Acidobacteriota bacterium]
MDKVMEYPQIIKRILTEYVELSNRRLHPEVEKLLVMDEARGHYLWLKLGWESGRRVKYITVYVRLRDGKFWIEEDWTEDGIAADLLRAGVPKEDIVLAFHDPETRKHTDFAAA